MGARSDINTHLLPFARPPGCHFRRPRLDTVATSATVDLIGDVIGLAVRSIVPRRVTEGIMTNVEIVPRTGGKVPSGMGWGAPLCRVKNIDPSRKRPIFPLFINI